LELIVKDIYSWLDCNKSRESGYFQGSSPSTIYDKRYTRAAE